MARPGAWARALALGGPIVAFLAVLGVVLAAGGDQPEPASTGQVTIPSATSTLATLPASATLVASASATATVPAPPPTPPTTAPTTAATTPTSPAATATVPAPQPVTSTSVATLPPPQGTGGPATATVRIVSASSPVAKGAYASLSAQVTPSSTCTLAYTNPGGSQSTAEGLVMKTADASGAVSWTWLIAAASTAGQGTARVSCTVRSGGASATASASVSIQTY